MEYSSSEDGEYDSDVVLLADADVDSDEWPAHDFPGTEVEIGLSLHSSTSDNVRNAVNDISVRETSRNAEDSTPAPENSQQLIVVTESTSDTNHLIHQLLRHQTTFSLLAFNSGDSTPTTSESTSSHLDSMIPLASTSSGLRGNSDAPVLPSPAPDEPSGIPKDSPRGKKRKKEHSNLSCSDSDEDSSGQCCPICMDEWSNTGSHRLCCLRCGHIYGESCIRRWLSTSVASSGRCPQCNAKAKLRDIRPIFARNLKAIDTAERDRLWAQLEEAKRDREQLELQVTKFTMANQMQKAEVEKLKAELDSLHKERTGTIVIPEPSENGITVSGDAGHTSLEGIDIGGCHFSLRSTVEIAREGGCRVAAHCETLNLVVVSQRSTNRLFPGFGVKKVDALEFRGTEFVPAHQKPIRDLAFAPPSAVRCLLLSASFDCTARLLDVGGGTNAVVATLSADTPLWSCCWDACNPHLLHVGTQGGIILSFDVRRTAVPVARISDPENITPVISLVPVQPSPGRSLPSGGLLACHLSSCWAHDPSKTGSVRLPHDGPFTALRYESNTQHFLVSARPSARVPHARHSVCERALRSPRMSSEESEASFSVCNPPVHTFLGGTSQRVLSRPCLLPVGRDLVVAAHQESSSTVALWSVGSGSRVATIPASDPVIDVCPLYSNGDTHVALLTEKMLRLYRIH